MSVVAAVASVGVEACRQVQAVGVVLHVALVRLEELALLEERCHGCLLVAALGDLVGHTRVHFCVFRSGQGLALRGHLRQVFKEVLVDLLFRGLWRLLLVALAVATVCFAKALDCRGVHRCLLALAAILMYELIVLR